jgi:hypothetical protein
MNVHLRLRILATFIIHLIIVHIHKKGITFEIAAKIASVNEAYLCVCRVHIYTNVPFVFANWTL